MKKITTKADFIQYQRFVQTSADKFDESLKELPDNMQEIIKTDKGVFPKHLTTEFFYELVLEQLQKLVPEFKIDAASRPVLKSICQYFSRDPEFNGSFNKGLLIMGGVGTGKTLLFKGLIETMNLFRYRDPHNYFGTHCYNFTIIPSYSFTEAFAKKGYSIFDEGLTVNGSTVRFTGPRLMIDDIGAENICSHFGSSTNIISEVLLRRYDAKASTYATTNLDRKHLKDFYGDRTYSRMIEMMNILIYAGNDRRH